MFIRYKQNFIRDISNAVLCMTREAMTSNCDIGTPALYHICQERKNSKGVRRQTKIHMVLRYETIPR